LLLAAALGLTCNPAFAQDAGDKAAAEALFAQGRDLLLAGNIAEACKRFEASQALDAGLGTLLRLADCYERADLRASAWATFKEAASLAESRGDAKRAEVAAVRAAALLPRLVYIQLDVPPGFPATAQIARNGRPIPRASWGAPVPVDAGTWHIVASAPGYADFSVDLDLKYGLTEPRRIAIPLLNAKPLPPSSATDPNVTANSEAQGQKTMPRAGSGASAAAVSTSLDAPPPESSTQKTLSLVLGGAGLVGLAAGGILGAVAARRASDSEANCRAKAPNLCSVEGTEQRDQALTFANIATVAGIAGAVSLAGGTILYITVPSPGSATTHASLGLRGTW